MPNAPKDRCLWNNPVVLLVGMILAGLLAGVIGGGVARLFGSQPWNPF